MGQQGLWGKVQSICRFVCCSVVGSSFAAVGCAGKCDPIHMLLLHISPLLLNQPHSCCCLCLVQGEGVTGEVFLAFGRVFSGVAREGARVHVLSSAYDPLAPTKQRQTAVLRGLYLMMGR
jgi:hypothetical protein